VIENERGEQRVREEEEHVCGGRCSGEGGLEAEEVGCLSGGCEAGVGNEEVVVMEDGEGDELEVRKVEW
jgi:hypothetical protein